MTSLEIIKKNRCAMEMCRVCLSTESNMIPVNESFIASYNVITSLHVKMYDELPQYTCLHCLQNVKLYMKFREKCISSETTLREVIFANLKPERKYIESNDNITELIDDISTKIKTEIKCEDDEDAAPVDDCFNDTLDEDILLSLNKIEDIKPKKRSKKLKSKSKTKLKVSKEIKQENVEELLCGLCTETLENNTELTNHLETHIKDRNCGLCKEAVTSWAQLLGHRLSHVPVKQKQCHICHKKFISNIYLEFHYQKMHFDGESTLSCKFCLRKYHTPRKLQKHIWGLHSEKKYFCDYCSKCFNAKTNLKSHILSHLKQKAYVCDLCGDSFNYMHGLKGHTIRRHTPQRVYCKNCKRVYPSQEEHDKHICSVKSLLCPTCGKRFSSSQLTRHLISHSTVSKFTCDRCPAAFRTKGGLQTHLNRHDGIKTKQCEYCSAKFYTGSTLIKHRRIHTGEKPYVCKVCHKGFTGNHNLKVHMKVHGEYLVNKKDKDAEITTDNIKF